MKVHDNLAAWWEARDALARRGDSLGFVPTMGALHAGHASLISASVAGNAATVVSIYVNPTQFNNPDDLSNYPDTLDADLALAERLGADHVIRPTYDEVYADDYRYQISEKELSGILCGAHRPGHFDGVLTVVMKLLNIVRADRAYFGEKDYQQFLLIRDMARAFFLQTEILACTTVREEDGLALSSRNLNLSAAGRETAPTLNRLLRSGLDDEAVAGELAAAGFDVDYVVSREGRRFGAASLMNGELAVRLIDNVELGE
ncbi:MAG: pantoate--beta-alanine ligase [Gammaproteobacteria bacterium]|nr:pantoate--beta-alanine ligase [Gammaproteobacteria bacterium]